MYVELLIDWLAGHWFIHRVFACPSLQLNKSTEISAHLAMPNQRGKGYSCLVRLAWTVSLIFLNPSSDWSIDWLFAIYTDIYLLYSHTYVYIGIYKQWIVGEYVEQVFTYLLGIHRLVWPCGGSNWSRKTRGALRCCKGTDRWDPAHLSKRIQNKRTRYVFLCVYTYIYIYVCMYVCVSVCYRMLPVFTNIV